MVCDLPVPGGPASTKLRPAAAAATAASCELSASSGQALAAGASSWSSSAGSGKVASGANVAEVCQKLEVSAATLARWRKQFRGMEDDQIKQLKALQEENRRLKKAVADLVLDKQIIEEVMKGKD